MFISVPLLAQRYFEIDVSDIAGDDSTYYLRNSHHNLLTVDFTLVNAADDSIDVGLTDDNLSYQSVEGSEDRIDLDYSTYAKSANGYTRARVVFMATQWPGTYIALKYIKGSATAGIIKVWY